MVKMCECCRNVSRENSAAFCTHCGNKFPEDDSVLLRQNPGLSGRIAKRDRKYQESYTQVAEKTRDIWKPPCSWDYYYHRDWHRRSIFSLKTVRYFFNPIVYIAVLRNPDHFV